MEAHTYDGHGRVIGWRNGRMASTDRCGGRRGGDSHSDECKSVWCAVVVAYRRRTLRSFISQEPVERLASVGGTQPLVDADVLLPVAECGHSGSRPAGRDRSTGRDRERGNNRHGDGARSDGGAAPVARTLWAWHRAPTVPALLELIARFVGSSRRVLRTPGDSSPPPMPAPRGRADGSALRARRLRTVPRSGGRARRREHRYASAAAG